jgi:hypothetical protein
MKVATAFLASATALFANSVTASVIPIGDVSVVENGNIKRQSCVNTATSRECWGDYSIDTNWYVTTLLPQYPPSSALRPVQRVGCFRTAFTGAGRS